MFTIDVLTSRIVASAQILFQYFRLRYNADIVFYSFVKLLAGDNMYYGSMTEYRQEYLVSAPLIPLSILVSLSGAGDEHGEVIYNVY